MHDGVDLSLNIFQDLATNLGGTGASFWPHLHIWNGLTNIIDQVTDSVIGTPSNSRLTTLGLALGSPSFPFYLPYSSMMMGMEGVHCKYQCIEENNNIVHRSSWCGTDNIP